MALSSLSEKMSVSRRPPDPSTRKMKVFELAGRQKELAAEMCDAAGRGDISRMRAALAQGADVNCEGMDWTPLMIAAANGKRKAVVFLLSKGAEVNLQNALGGVTALMLASGTKHKRIVKLLVSKGADLFAVDDTGTTAMGFAISHGHQRVARYLASQMASEKKKPSKSALPLAALAVFSLSLDSCGQDYANLSPPECNDHERSVSERHNYSETDGIQDVETVTLLACDGSEGLLREDSSFSPSIEVHMDDSPGPALPRGRTTVKLFGEEYAMWSGGLEHVSLSKELSSKMLSVGDRLEVHRDYYLVLDDVDAEGARVHLESKDGTYVSEGMLLHNGYALETLEVPDGPSFDLRLHASDDTTKTAHVALLGERLTLHSFFGYQGPEGEYTFTVTTDDRGIAGWSFERIQ
jgi:hypothetical protein